MWHAMSRVVYHPVGLKDLILTPYAISNPPETHKVQHCQAPGFMWACPLQYSRLQLSRQAEPVGELCNLLELDEMLHWATCGPGKVTCVGLWLLAREQVGVATAKRGYCQFTTPGVTPKRVRVHKNSSQRL